MFANDIEQSRVRNLLASRDERRRPTLCLRLVTRLSLRFGGGSGRPAVGAVRGVRVSAEGRATRAIRARQIWRRNFKYKFESERRGRELFDD